MSGIEKHAPGTFCWVELGTSDPVAAKSFYTSLFGWSGVDNPMDKGMFYTMLQLNGQDVGGLYGLMEEQKKQGVPPHWMPYVSVENADQVAARANELGGKVLHPPMDVFEHGRMAVLQDPQGAVFSLWQPMKHIGARSAEMNNRHCWTELNARDAASAKEFYTRLFGWTTHEQQMGPTAYTSWINEGKPAGGMLQMTAEWGDVPPHWMVYFSVADCDGSVAKAESLGGKACVQPTEVPGVGRMSVLNDPQGAYFSIIQLAMPPQG